MVANPVSEFKPAKKIAVAKPAPIIEVEALSLFYGSNQALKNVSLTIAERVVTAFIGPSGCGKSTLLRCFNRMNDLIAGVLLERSVRIAHQDSNNRAAHVIELRT